MHTFQPLPFDLVEFNPFTKIGKEWALVTAGSREKANTMTVSWGGVGSSGAKMLLSFLFAIHATPKNSSTRTNFSPLPSCPGNIVTH